jgi:hypothetical protein
VKHRYCWSLGQWPQDPEEEAAMNRSVIGIIIGVLVIIILVIVIMRLV